MTGFFRAAISKFAAVIILLAALGGIANGIALPVANAFGSLQTQIAEQRALLGRFIQAAVEDRQAATAGSGAKIAEKQAFLAGESDSIRVAGLQTTLNDVAATANVRLASTRALDPVAGANFRLLGVAAQFSANLDQLQGLLFNLEKQHPNLRVSALQIARSPQPPGRGLPALDVNLTLQGAAPPASAPGTATPKENP